MRIIIYGTGAVGGNYGGYLMRAGADVTFIARGEHLRVLRERGLQLESPKGNFLVRPVQATDDPAKAGVADVIFLCTKAWQLEEIAGTFAPMIGPETVVVPLQNWIEAPDFLVSRIGGEHVLGGVCYTIARIVRPGVISGDGGLIIFGELNGAKTARTEKLEQMINRATGISGKNTPDIRKEMWKKFAWISSAGVVGAATKAPCGIWRKIPETRALYETVLRESFAVARAKSVELTESEFTETMNWMDGRPEGFKTSMQRDMAAGGRSELAYQVGSIVRLGTMLNVPVPTNQALYAALLPSELRAQAKTAFD